MSGRDAQPRAVRLGVGFSANAIIPVKKPLLSLIVAARGRRPLSAATRASQYASRSSSCSYVTLLPSTVTVLSPALSARSVRYFSTIYSVNVAMRAPVSPA